MVDDKDQDYPETPSSPPRLARFLMQVLWPAFVGAIVAVGLLFSLIDPLQFNGFIVYLGGSREAAYTVGFLFLWAVFSFACSLTWFLASTESRQMPRDKQARRD
ncbi:MAG: hypothetical protein ACI8VW_003139 [bacterium]|jgi:hypothetical protein